MTDLISFDFESRAVRVVQLDGTPWWIAADVAALLGYRNAPDMTRNLDDDEKGTHIVRPLYSTNTPSGGAQSHTIISESGLFAAVLKSRRPEARRFRRWVTGEVLPALRRHGSYSLPHVRAGEEWDSARLSASVAAVREARRLYGPQSARLVWQRLGLPSPVAGPQPEADPLMSPLAEWCAGQGECTIDQAGAALGLDALDEGQRLRLGRLLRALGWHPHKVRRHGRPVNLFTPRSAAAQAVQS